MPFGKIKVEYIYDLIIEKLQIENYDERKDAVGDTLYEFFEIFIPQYGINTSNGIFKDSYLCAKFTGILLDTSATNLLKIILNNNTLIETLKYLLAKLIENKT